MSKIAIMTDSNAGINQEEAVKEGVFVLPMPFYINDQVYFEDIDLTQDQFYEKLTAGVDIHTSMPSPGATIDFWNNLLKDFDQIIYIPMSSGLSSSCATAAALAADDFVGKVFVVDNQRISITMKQSVFEARDMAAAGKTAEEIVDALMRDKAMSRIYIQMDTLEYLKKGGRLTPAAAAIGTLLKLKPVLKIYGEKLDSFAKPRSFKQGKQIMMDQIKKDLKEFLNDPEAKNCRIDIAHTQNYEAALEFRNEVRAEFPNQEVWIDPLSLSVSCHIGPGALAIAATKITH